MGAYQNRLSPQTKEKIVMLEPNEFFQNQVKQCRSQAESACNKNDREFWLRLAHRWETLLLAGCAAIEAAQSQTSSVRDSERSRNNSQKVGLPSLNVADKHSGQGRKVCGVVESDRLGKTARRLPR
jgi:hypothetical protein